MGKGRRHTSPESRQSFSSKTRCNGVQPRLSSAFVFGSTMDYVLSICVLSNTIDEAINTNFGGPHFTVSRISVIAVLVAVVLVHRLGL